MTPQIHRLGITTKYYYEEGMAMAVTGGLQRGTEQDSSNRARTLEPRLTGTSILAHLGSMV